MWRDHRLQTSDHGGGDESADEALRAFAGMDSGERGVPVIDADTTRGY